MQDSGGTFWFARNLNFTGGFDFEEGKAQGRGEGLF